MKTIKLKHLSNGQFNEVKSWLNYLDNELIFLSENTLIDDEVYFIPSGYTIKGIKYYYLIFESEYATTWTSNVNVYHTNDNEFIDRFIEEKEVYC